MYQHSLQLKSSYVKETILYMMRVYHQKQKYVPPP